MRADRVLVADVHPAADFQLRQFRCRMDFDALADEDHAAGDDVRVGQLELQQPPVAHQIPRGIGAVAQHPPQRGQREELGLAWVPQIRPPPAAMDRGTPHARHGRKAYRRGVKHREAGNQPPLGRRRLPSHRALADSPPYRAALVICGIGDLVDCRRGRLRQYRLLGRHRAGRGLARAVRRRGQQQLQRDTRR